MKHYKLISNFVGLKSHYMFSIRKATTDDCLLIRNLASQIWGADLWFYPLP